MADPPPFVVVDVSDWPVVGDEMMGTKPKCWLAAASGDKWLFKPKSRENSEDDWSEKVAAEVAGQLGVPHAQVELATRHGSRGVVSLDLVGAGDATEMILGNSLLVEVDQTYATETRYHLAQHTLDRVLSALSGQGVVLEDWPGRCPEVRSAADLFTGYLMLDAWVGNTDRHHENWAVLRVGQGATSALVLCPSYDHASCLGHNLRDEERSRRLDTKDRGYNIAAFAAKARSALFASEAATEPMSTVEAFRAAALCPAAARAWLARLHEADEAATTDIVNRVPASMMTEGARRFALALLRENRSRLLALPL